MLVQVGGAHAVAEVGKPRSSGRMSHSQSVSRVRPCLLSAEARQLGLHTAGTSLVTPAESVRGG